MQRKPHIVAVETAMKYTPKVQLDGSHEQGAKTSPASSPSSRLIAVIIAVKMQCCVHHTIHALNGAHHVRRNQNLASISSALVITRRNLSVMAAG